MGQRFAWPRGRDKLLIQVAERLRANTPDADTVARLGGDEFAVIQRGLGPRVNAESLARRLVQILSAPYRIDGDSVLVGASIGIAIAPLDGGLPDDLAIHADLALYRAKHSGRGVFRFFQSDTDVPRHS